MGGGRLGMSDLVLLVDLDNIVINKMEMILKLFFFLQW
jgi:hypothetical protein